MTAFMLQIKQILLARQHLEDGALLVGVCFGLQVVEVSVAGRLNVWHLLQLVIHKPFMPVMKACNS